MGWLGGGGSGGGGGGGGGGLRGLEVESFDLAALATAESDVIQIEPVGDPDYYHFTHDWDVDGYYWKPETPYSEGDVVISDAGLWIAVTAGVSGSDSWVLDTRELDVVEDGTVTWSKRSTVALPTPDTARVIVIHWDGPGVLRLMQPDDWTIDVRWEGTLVWDPDVAQWRAVHPIPLTNDFYDSAAGFYASAGAWVMEWDNSAVANIVAGGTATYPAKALVQTTYGNDDPGTVTVELGETTVFTLTLDNNETPLIGFNGAQPQPFPEIDSTTATPTEIVQKLASIGLLTDTA